MSEGSRLKLTDSKDRKRSNSTIGKKNTSGGGDGVQATAPERSPNLQRSNEDKRQGLSSKV